MEFKDRYITLVEQENKLLKTQLLELNQANVNLHNENEKLKKEFKTVSDIGNDLLAENKKLKENIKSGVDFFTDNLIFRHNEKNTLLKDIHDLEQELDNYKNKSNLISDLDNQYFLQAKKHLDRVHELEELNEKLFSKNQELERVNVVLNNKLDNPKPCSININIDEGLKNAVIELKEQLELKETINQDLVKKYQLLEEEIQAYDINMLELVESYKKLEQDYKNL